ncbi:MAG: tail-specific protease [Gammaproteobacteria bacterium]|uniref:Tail-specific protease n=1 Tax=OM182 bacterium TaxID=2510334 RepID=A0A520RYG8_9GAMM|nr:tail-specific protease [Gammaproteobacteria bacterium]RZO75283.1 MAG: tail-specific protease [OM182 bacterium]
MEIRFSLKMPKITREVTILICLYLSLTLQNIVASEPPLKTEELQPLAAHGQTTREIVNQLNAKHYVKVTLDDALSEKVFDRYLGNLDPQKYYFLQEDVDSFQELRHELDDAIKTGDLDPAFNIWNVYHQRLISRFVKIITFLENGIAQLDFTKNEKMLLDRLDHPWATSEAELDDIWRKRIKDAALSLKLAGKDTDEIKELLIKRYTNRLGLTRQTKSEDVYQLYINSFTETYDPHTQYYSPRSMENFNINMSLSLEGIGAVLQQDEEFTKVVSLVPAGPADKARTLKPNDKIIGVGQDQETVVDVIGWRLSDVVQLIRGKKNTTVWLDIIPSGLEASDSKIIQITRNTVKLEEQAAKAEVIELEKYGKKHKIGIIDVPAFYADFKALQAGDKNYRSTTRDVRNLLEELKLEQVEGVIIDLRNNGGGSLTEARNMTGLFIDRGPIVQIRYKNNRVEVFNDQDKSTSYEGPLGVMVNRLSASASEIFAGAIQDYNRGIIIGSQTFGKGTVQTIVPLNRGQLKLTQMKFYRVSGESNQHRGIIPDITYPDNFDPEVIGESALDDPLPWDTIRATKYRAVARGGELIPRLKTSHQSRIKSDPEFIYEQSAIAFQRKQAKKEFRSLNKDVRINEKNKAEAFWLDLENQKRRKQGLITILSLDELDSTRSSSDAGLAGRGLEINSQYQSDSKKISVQYDEYGITKIGDSLWDIALQVRTAKALSIQQTMLALQRLNPDAFIYNNINLLKTGYVLKIPNSPDLIRDSKAQAITQVKTQNQAFQEYKLNRTWQLDTPRQKTDPTPSLDQSKSVSSENSQLNIKEEAYAPDAFVTETGNILIDLMSDR